jgi:hypothetical protein
MEASDAAAMPLPSEDTTPPVTKIRGVMESSRAGNWHFSCRSVPLRDGEEEFPALVHFRAAQSRPADSWLPKVGAALC